MKFHITKKSANSKTGNIPVTTSSKKTCWAGCPFYEKVCYARYSFLGYHWAKVTSGERGESWAAFIESIKAFKPGQLWRHNQAGDLPGVGARIDPEKLHQLVEANKGKRGFTYTHKPLTPENQEAIAYANASGFTVNLSANTLHHADELIDLDIAPVCVVLPGEYQGNIDLHTPKGRRVVVCPATYRDDVTCKSCALCQKQRSVVVAFPAHGSGKGAVAA